MFFTYLWRELLRRKRQTMLVVAALGLAVGLVVTVSATTSGVQAAQDEVLGSLYGVGTDLTVTRTAVEPGDGNGAQFQFGPPDQADQRQKVSGSRLMMRPGAQSLAASSVKKVAGLDGVSSAVGVLVLDSVNLDGILGQAPSTSMPGGVPSTPQGGTASNLSVGVDSVNGVDTSTTAIGPLSAADIVDGRGFSSSDKDALVAQVDQTYATANEVKVGDRIEVGGKKFEVVGIVASNTGGETTAADIYIPLARAQQLAHLGDKVSTLYVEASSSDQIEAVSSDISRSLSDVTVSTSEDLANQVSGSLASASTLVTGMGRWLSVAVVLAAVLLAALLTLSSVSRRVREFGTLKAIGWPSRRVVGQVLGEASVQGLLGGLAGIVLGLVGISVVNAVAPELSATVGTSELPGPMSEQLQRVASVALHATASPQVMVLAVAVAIAGGVIAGLFGGWRASRMRPAVALRSID